MTSQIGNGTRASASTSTGVGNGVSTGASNRRRRRPRQWFNAVVLRWQGRLEGPMGDWLIPAVVATALFAVLWGSSSEWAAGPVSAGQLAPAVQSMWLVGNGVDPVVTSGSGVHVLADGFGLLLYPVALATRFLPTVGTLLFLQSAALAVAVLPLWRLARVGASLRVGAATVVVVAYAVYPVVHAANVTRFSPTVVALPGLLWAASRILTGSRRVWLPVGLVLLAGSAMGLAVAGLGLSMWLVGRRRVGTILMPVGLGWTLLTYVVAQPLAARPDAVPLGGLEVFGTSPVSALWGLVTQPGDVMAVVGSESAVLLAATVFGPVLFLPFLAPRLLVGMVPVQAAMLLAHPGAPELAGQLAVPTTAFVFLSTAFALSRLGRMGTQRVTVDWRLLVALLLAGAVFFVAESPTSPYREPWNWGEPEVVEARRQLLAPILEGEVLEGGVVEGRTDGGVAVGATTGAVDLVAERQVLRTIATSGRPDAATAATGVEVIIIDDRDIEAWDPVRRRVFADGLKARGFTRVDGERGGALARQGLVVWEAGR